MNVINKSRGFGDRRIFNGDGDLFMSECYRGRVERCKSGDVCVCVVTLMVYHMPI